MDRPVPAIVLDDICLRPCRDATGNSISAFKAAAEQRFAEAGWEIRDRNNAAPGIRRFVEQIAMFLTLVAMTALAVGGIGGSQAVSAFLDRKRAEIATLKSLGAEGALIFRSAAGARSRDRAGLSVPGHYGTGEAARPAALSCAGGACRTRRRCAGGRSFSFPPSQRGFSRPSLVP